MNSEADFIVVGSGIAGLNAALTLADFGNVIVITKKNISDSSTNIAQGGIAAVTQKEDSVLFHEKDTMTAGAFHNNKNAVQFLVKNGNTAIEQLIKIGVPFEKKSTLEAAHSFPRILHATDITGHEIEKAMVTKIRSIKNITVLEHTYAIDCIVKNNTCFGIQILKKKTIYALFSRCVVIATGGIGHLYSYTTNPSVATADGIAMGYRANASLADLEFVQFHPTALKGKTSPLFLLSEALRGEGAYLVDTKGNRFMSKIHKDAELAPRDVVARAIFKKQKDGDVFIDIRHKGKEYLQKRFPNIYRILKVNGFNLSTDIIPITPAEHFLCGGIKTDLYGQTTIQNLFAYGEVAYTGVHGANRLASNSLLEGMVFSSQIKHCIKSLPKKITQIKVNVPKYKDKTKNNIKKQVQEIMWNYVGIERSKIGLTIAVKKLKKLEIEINKQTKNGINKELLETKNITQAAILITKAALKRKTSLGAHFIK